MYYEGQLIEILRDEPNDADLEKGDVVEIAFVDITEDIAGNDVYEIETTCGWYLTDENFKLYRKPIKLPEELFTL